MMRMAVSVGRDQLGSVGVCFGKFSKTGKFKLHITALDHLAQYAQVSVCVCVCVCWLVTEFVVA